MFIDDLKSVAESMKQQKISKMNDTNLLLAILIAKGILTHDDVKSISEHVENEMNSTKMRMERLIQKG